MTRNLSSYFSWKYRNSTTRHCAIPRTTFDRRNTWIPNITKKQKHKLKAETSKLSVLESFKTKNKIEIKKLYLLKLVWTYTPQIYGTVKKTQLTNFKTFGTITKHYGHHQHTGLHTPTVNEHTRPF